MCDGFLLVNDGRAEAFDGDLDDYVAWLGERREAEALARADGGRAAEKAARREAREAAAAERQARLALRRPLLREAEELERRLADWQEERRALDELLADPEFYSGPESAQLEEYARRQRELDSRIDAAEERWLLVHAELEQIGET